VEVRCDCYAYVMPVPKSRRRKLVISQKNINLNGDPPETGPYLSTFTFRLPFRLGISDSFDQTITLPSEYASAPDSETFAMPPFVRLRLFNAAILDRKFSPANAAAAVRRFYDADWDVGHASEVDPHLYEQWVSVETPAALLVGEVPTDGAYAFHRSLAALNSYLQAFALARNDNTVRQVSSRELRPIVIIGQLALDGNWGHKSVMLMHPDAKARPPLSSRPVAEHTDSLNRATETMLRGNPFVRSWQWKARAERRRYEGDDADAVVSFQIAAEVLLFELWALLLADEGNSPSEISELRRDTPFSTLVRAKLGSQLGGSWDTTRPNTPVGRYWSELYELRIRVVHAGYLPHGGDADQAEHAYENLENFLDERLRAKAKRYPSAFKARRDLAEVTRFL
jgi:hypothetical protein